MSDLLSCTTKLDEPRVLYVCCSASRELRGVMEWSIQRIPCSRLVAHVFYTCAFRMKSYEGWHALFKMNMSLVVMSPHLSYVCIPHVEYARQGYTPFKRRVSEVGRYPCSGLTHGYRFYSDRQCMWTLPWRAGTEGSFSAGTLTTFRKSISANWIAPTSYYKESRL
jgi:hypothetical protein